MYTFSGYLLWCFLVWGSQCVLGCCASAPVVPGAAAALGRHVPCLLYHGKLLGCGCSSPLFLACFSHDELHFGPQTMKGSTSKAVGNHACFSTLILFCPPFPLTPSFEKLKYLAQSPSLDSDKMYIPFSKNNSDPESRAINLPFRAGSYCHPEALLAAPLSHVLH